jgi:hypothetical protein
MLVLLAAWGGCAARAQADDYEYLGPVEPFWRCSAALGGYNIGGDFQSNGQGLKTVPDYVTINSDFAYVKRPYSKENFFADHLSLVRILGGFSGGGSDSDIRAQDLVYTNAAGEYEYRMDLLEDRLTPYLENGYTNFTVVFDNIPWDFTDAPDDESFGQCGIPRDFDAWTEFVSVFCSNLVRVVGEENTGSVRFRTGTEFNSSKRFNGTESEFMDYYNSCWRGVSNVLPHAQFGPFNFYYPGIADMDANVSPHNVNTFQIPLQKDAAAPFDWVSSSIYYAAGSSPAALAVPLVDVWDEFSARFPALPFTREVHEFGYAGEAEPGAFGGAMTAQMMMRFRAAGLDKLWHWWMLDEFRDQDNALQGLLVGDAWIYSILERTRGGESWLMNPVSSSSTGTEHLGFYARKDSSALMMLSAFNKNLAGLAAEEAVFRIPKSGGELNLDKLRFVTLNRETAVHDEIFSDLQAESLLSTYYQSNPNRRGRVNAMVLDTDGAREGAVYVGENLERYQRFWQDSLLLKPISERGGVTITDEGDSYIVTAQMNVPEVLVIQAPVHQAADAEWADPAAGGNWDDAENWSSGTVPAPDDSVQWLYAAGYPAISITSPVAVRQLLAERSVAESYNNRTGGLKILNFGDNAGSLTVDDGAGVIDMHVDDWYGARLYVANADSNAASSVVQADWIDVDSFTLGSVPDGNSYYTHDSGYLGMQLNLQLGDASSTVSTESVFRQTGGQIHVEHRDYPLSIGTVNQRGRFILDAGVYSGGLSFGNTNSVFEFNAGRVRSGNRDVDWGGVASVTGTVQFAEEGTRELTVYAGRTVTVKPTVHFEDKPYCTGSFLKSGDGTICFEAGVDIDLSGSIRVEAGTVELQTTNLNPQLSLILDENGAVNLNFSGTAAVQRISFDGGETWQSSGTFDSSDAQFSGTGTLELRDFYYHWKEPALGGYWNVATNWLEEAVPPANMGAVWSYADGRPVVQITHAAEVADLIVEMEPDATQQNTYGLYIDNWDSTDGSLTVKKGYGNIDMGVAHLRIYNNDPDRAADILNFNRFTGRGFDLNTHGGTSYYTHESGEIETSVSIALSMANNAANRVEFRQTGGSVFCNNTSWSLQLGNKYGTSRYILDGGICSFTMYFNGYTSSFEFNNGTWQSRTKNFTWKAPTIPGQVLFSESGTHVIEVSGGQNLTVTADVTLTDKPGEEGTFVKTGTGEMIVQSGLDLSGQVDVEEGTLTLSDSNMNSNLIVVVEAGSSLNLDFSGTGVVHAASFDGGATWAGPGVWGGAASSAPNTASVLAGTGVLAVLDADPAAPAWVDGLHISFSDADQLVISWDGTAGEQYAVQFTEDLVHGVWTNLQEDVAGAGVVRTTNSVSSPQGFYRAHRVN